ncbi:hypothetical protein B9G69_003325 [Bdellovibrio sp. SKB1291214]|uniref:hypothetical protein n=1 Tax=Bdellovibrio sp. SKB1291214 TaxID=1732569 RepID=UPI000B51ADA0|nr:hypothetical protein [Bdellovibrio sp. SKB1291214]UYL09602.1 hypothetical protein B9G69_003325 [Bdellovibrio sp. SKB1291214]
MKKICLHGTCILVVMLLSACAGKQVVPEEQGNLLFPDGRYSQDVEVEVTATKPVQNFDFSCIVQKRPKEMLFYGYNSFGISLFKIKEVQGQPIESESSIEQIKQHKDFFIKIFRLVKTIVNLRKDDPRRKGDEILLEQDGISAHVTFSGYDDLGVPLNMTVQTKGQYQVQIKTTSYKFMTEKDRR